MARLADSFLEGRGFGQDLSAKILNPANGGQMGYSPDLREWVSSGKHIRRNLIPLLLEAPTFFSLMPDPQVWYQGLRAMMELHPRSIEGLNSTITVETAETPVGGAGEQLEEFTNVTRARSNPTFTWDELKGRPFQNLLEGWIFNGMMDPATKVANIGTLATGRPDDMLGDRYTATMCFIEPDETHQFVVQAWLCTNMAPKSGGERTGSRNITEALQMNQLNIEFTALTQVGVGVNRMAQLLLNKINLVNANPNLRPAFINDIAPDVAREAKGYINQTEELGRTAITPGA